MISKYIVRDWYLYKLMYEEDQLVHTCYLLSKDDKQVVNELKKWLGKKPVIINDLELVAGPVTWIPEDLIQELSRDMDI